jgi:hypothetical protein
LFTIDRFLSDEKENSYKKLNPRRWQWWHGVELNGTITEFEVGTCDIHSFFFIYEQ